ncbi:hypothetical protein, partial [Pseudomonas viridiflava]|uniref:hypothetical protein n=1 Tax=Pseudomonas viridiflava TaxID=33069 RepID=UPI00197E0355
LLTRSIKGILVVALCYFIYWLVSSLAGNLFPLRSLASASRRRALFFFLAKRSKTQGLDLMSDKFVKALFRQHKHPMKDRERTRCLGLWGMEDCGRSFNVFSFHHLLGRIA